MDRVTDVTRDCFSRVFQLRRLGAGSAVRPETLLQQMRRGIDDLLEKAGEEGFNQADAQDIAYALVALIDEVALTQGEAIRDYWMRNLLQFHYFKENQAGDGFFERLEQVRADPNREEVLRVYYLCLLFGFQGRYHVRGGEAERMDLLDRLAREVGRTRRVDTDVLAPRAVAPSEGLSFAGVDRRMVFAAAGAVLLAVLLFGGLKLGLAHDASGLAQLASASQGSGETR